MMLFPLGSALHFSRRGTYDRNVKLGEWILALPVSQDRAALRRSTYTRAPGLIVRYSPDLPRDRPPRYCGGRLFFGVGGAPSATMSRHFEDTCPQDRTPDATQG